MARTPSTGHTSIIRIPTRFAACYLLPSKTGWVVFDTDLPGSERTILRTLHKHGGQPEDVALILLSHAHPDHAGSAAALRRCTRAPIAIHPGDADALRTGSKAIPPTDGMLVDRCIRALLSMGAAFLRTQPVEPDLLLSDGQHLDRLGLCARVIHTPGHTPGSSSLLLETGEAFIGDAVGMEAGRPRHNRLLADPQAALDSLRKLANLPAHTFYPGHAGSFSANQLRRLVDTGGKP
jgi:glyoxylase-like metal-dependent hydrolase (beta-lactamase superfamily II)